MGKSKYKDFEGNFYEAIGTGYFEKGKIFGQGWKTYVNGDLYEGEFWDGVKSGFGRMIYTENLEDSTRSLPGPNEIADEVGSFNKPVFGIYTGYFLTNMRNGEGQMKWKDGSSFSGVWVKDNWFEGKLEFNDGTYYKG